MNVSRLGALNNLMESNAARSFYRLKVVVTHDGIRITTGEREGSGVMVIRIVGGDIDYVKAIQTSHPQTFTTVYVPKSFLWGAI